MSPRLYLYDIKSWIEVDIGVGKANRQEGDDRIGGNDKTDAHDPV
jgi:hypothetical protein